MNYRSELATLLSNALDSYTRSEQLPQETRDSLPAASDLETLIEVPRDQTMGDLAFPCFRLAKPLRKAPPAIAAGLQQALDAQVENSALFAKVVATGPYLNATISTAALAESTISSILSGAATARRNSTERRVMVEYSQPNTHKAFHVGHIRCAALGDSICRVLDWCGDDVIPVNYPGDEGTHVAKCLWYYLNHHKGKIPEENKGEFLGKLYVLATEMLDLATYSQVPLRGVVTAQVVDTKPHPKKDELSVVEVKLASEDLVTVLCAGIGFAAGDIVAYAPPGKRVKGKVVGVIEKAGVTSTGMICSEAELGLSQNNDKILTLDSTTPLGVEICTLFPKEGAPQGQEMLALLGEYEAGVSEVLQSVESGSGELYDLWRTTRQWSLDEFDEIYEWLQCRFDKFFFESELTEASKEHAEKYLEKGVFVRDEGAIGIDLNDVGLGFCLLIKRDGTALYAARDLALAEAKFNEYKVDKSIYVVGAEQTLHFQQVFETLKRMNFPQAEFCQHISYGLVVKPDGKMSSRKGNVILLSELQKKLTSQITAEYLEKYRGEWSDEEIDTAAYRLSLATIRYGMLNQDNNSQIVFDLDEWTARSGNTGPYLMYQYARIQSILKDAEVPDTASIDWVALEATEEHQLLLSLAKFEEAMVKSKDSMAAQPLCAYLYSLTKDFSRMYQQCSILKADTAQQKSARLALAASCAAVLRKGFELLGILPLERM